MAEESERSAAAAAPAATNGSAGGSAAISSAFDNSRRFALADLLRDCAVLVEENEMKQQTFQSMFLELTAYVQAHGSANAAGGSAAESTVPPVTSVNSSSTAASNEAEEPAKPATVVEETSAPPQTPAATRADPTFDTPHAGNHPDPPGLSQAPRANSSARSRVTTTTTQHFPPPPSSTSSRSRNGEESALSKEKMHNFLGKIKSNVKEMGHEFTHIAHTGQRKLSSAAKSATSNKNAQRARADIASELGGNDDWCEEHFTKGCGCKQMNRRSSDARSNTGASENNSHRSAAPSRPPFQRPVNPSSSLIANGWLEQQRRSKMRTVWKEVLVSLVAGRRPGEETTLWVQRETHNPVTGAAGLEALHQIPIKGMQDINYVDFSVDHRFTIQVYNLNDEFVFRASDNGDAAKNWVSTLRLTREAIINGVAPPKGVDLQGASNRTKTYPGYSEDEKKAESPPQQREQQAQQEQQQDAPPQQPQTSRRLSVRDLRAIAHAHGVNTAGMERGELEAIVAKIQQQNGGRVTPHPPPGPPPPSAQKPDPQASAPFDEEAHQDREAQHREEAERRARQMKIDEEVAARAAAEEAAEAERRRRVAQEEERRHAEYLRQQEIHRQQQAQAAAQRKWQEDQRAAQQAAAAAEAERRRYQQQQQYYVQQQRAQWNQQYPPQQPHPQWNPQAQGQPRPAPPAGYPPHGQPPPQQHGHPPPGQQQAGPRPGPPPPQGATNRWVNMAAEDQGDGGQATISAIKHDVLVKWALQPPTFQMLRNIDALLTTIHNVFPPNLGVPGHDYFKKWKVLTMEALSENGRPEEAKLAKAVKKLRFFLHPDKLPRDLTDEQSFVCKMAWDITNDSWEEYEKRKEDLDWIRGE